MTQDHDSQLASQAGLPAGMRPLGTEIPFGKSVGITVVNAQDGNAQMALILTPEHLNSAGAAHGGVILTMLDIAMAVAARSSAMDSLGCATIDLTASFVRPSGGEGARLTSTAKVYDRSRTMRFCEATVESADGRLIARGSGTFKVIRRSP